MVNTENHIATLPLAAFVGGPAGGFAENDPERIEVVEGQDRHLYTLRVSGRVRNYVFFDGLLCDEDSNDYVDLADPMETIVCENYGDGLIDVVYRPTKEPNCFQINLAIWEGFGEARVVLDAKVTEKGVELYENTVYDKPEGRTFDHPFETRTSADDW